MGLAIKPICVCESLLCIFPLFILQIYQRSRAYNDDGETLSCAYFAEIFDKGVPEETLFYYWTYTPVIAPKAVISPKILLFVILPFVYLVWFNTHAFLTTGLQNCGPKGLWGNDKIWLRLLYYLTSCLRVTVVSVTFVLKWFGLDVLWSSESDSIRFVMRLYEYP